MKKRFPAWLLCLCMVCALVPAAAFGEEDPPAAEEPATSGDFWKVEGGTLTITGEMAYTGDAPWLAHKDSITQAIIEEGVTAIPEKAFAELTGCCVLRIPASVTAIGDNAFLHTGSACTTGYGVYLFTGYTQAQTESWGVADYGKYGLVYTRTNLIYDHYDLDDHDYEPYAEPSTCTANGFSGQACRCGSLLGDTLPQADHTPETIPAIPATCTEKGKSEGTKCSVCGEILSAPSEVDMIPHTPVAVKEKMPSSTEDGYTAGTRCSDCGTVLSGCEVIKASNTACSGVVLTDEGNAEWVLYENGTLTILSGKGNIKEAPWLACESREYIKTVMVCEGITGLPEGAFKDCDRLTTVSLPRSLTSVEAEAFSGCDQIKEIYLPNVTVIGNGAFYNCSKLETVYCYGTEAQWKDMVIGLNNEALTGAKIVYLYKETVANKVTLNLDGTGLEGLTVYIDGVAYTGEDRVKGEKVSVSLPNGKARTAVIYTWNKTGDDVDPHEKYPTAMYVWMLSQEDGMYVSTRVSALDNILAYAGSSIRIAGKKGIRMITGVTETAKKGLTGSKGFEGYTLVEYGTIVAWVEDLKGADLVLSTPGVKGGQAYSKADRKDAVYKKTNGQVQYTNVLVGFTEEQCKPDLAMRPYMILEDAQGNRYTLYGGTVERSIGYIAYQNRSAFKSGTPSYEYIWSIIHVVYGDKYDADYKK